MDYVIGPILRKDHSNSEYFRYLLQQFDFILEHMPDNVIYMEKRDKIEHIKKELSKLI